MKELMIQLHTMEEVLAAQQQSQVVVFTFSAEWCPDCQFIKPFMPALIKEFADITFYYIDRDECMEAAKSMMVMGIPSFVAFKDGIEVKRFVSKVRKSETEIRQFLESLT